MSWMELEPMLFLSSFSYDRKSVISSVQQYYGKALIIESCIRDSEFKLLGIDVSLDVGSGATFVV